jgi:hypothetical protein
MSGLRDADCDRANARIASASARAFYPRLRIGSSPFGVMFTTVSNLLAMPLRSAAATL